MQSRSEAEQAEQIARQLRAVRTAMEQSQVAPSANSQMRLELRAELQALEARRDEIGNQLRNPMVSGANKNGLENRIVQLDARIASLDQRIAELDGAVARAGGARQGFGTGMPPMPGRREPNPPPEAGMIIGALFVLCVLLPLSIAYARRLWHRGAAAAGSLPKEIADRLSRMDQNLDAIALEVERIGEGQRFLTRAHAEQQQGLPAGAAERVETPERARERQRGGA